MVVGVNQTDVASRRDTELRRLLNEGVEVKADDVLERLKLEIPFPLGLRQINLKSHMWSPKLPLLKYVGRGVKKNQVNSR